MNAIGSTDLVNSTTQENPSSKIDTLHWYAIYTRPRFEKKVDAQLKEKGFESYLPLHTVVRQWSDRRKKVEEPLFRGYVFVRTTPRERVHSLQIIGAVRMVGFGGRPSIVPDEQIEAVRRILKEGLKVETIDYIQTGDLVEVVQGPLMGLKGVLMEKRHRGRFVISIDSIRQSISVEIDVRDVRKIG